MVLLVEEALQKCASTLRVRWQEPMVSIHLIILYQVDHCQLLKYDMHLYCFCFPDQLTGVVPKCQMEAK